MLYLCVCLTSRHAIPVCLSSEPVFPTAKNYTCGAILTDLSGNITSPGYWDIGHYANNQVR